MAPDNQTALFRAHATARLRRDTAGAARLAAQIDPEQHMPHLLFTLTLFTQFVVEELGYEPEPADLVVLTKRLHDKHFQPGGTFEALRAEAMVRAVTVEPVLLYEIPSAEQASYMWAVIDHLADPSMTGEELTERFELAEEARLEMVGHALESPPFTPSGPKAARTDPAPEPVEAQAGPVHSAPAQHAPAQTAPAEEGTEQ